ncbi:FG-GAP-like repeat-containing protein [Pseudoxanthomonas sp. LH2527]|uniref:NHL domain-containing protein n=1 Tax=Pseudoxanthomonas sp. LH2527 TaxID=2923249 RepID=UPI001F141008|nr:FG-GAP-like repeat-containing protein [Pseudoxanthomonas sp. LH2527]MCH6484830.1 FG-GAP-like repeat-containing protein [Pseudoxanthomonas sp. LH2527]
MDMQGSWAAVSDGRNEKSTVRGRRMLRGLLLAMLLPVLSQASSSTSPALVSVAGGGSQLGDGGPATQAAFGQPVDVAIDGQGNTYVADVGHARVRKISGNGTITTVAGNGSTVYSGDGGAATAAGMQPAAIAMDAAGNLYIADHAGSRIRKVTQNGIISTIAGTGTRGYSGDGGPATAARLYDPADVEVDAAGNVYIADFGNHRIRRITPGGTITTIAGTGANGYGGMGGPATQADLGNPVGLAVSSRGDIYVVHDFLVSRIDRDGTIMTVAGNGMFSGDPAATSRMDNVRDVAIDGRDNVYISTSHTIQMVTPEGGMHHVAGTQDTRDGRRNTTYGFGGDGGPATQALLYGPSGIALDATGSLLIADRYNARVRRLDPVPHPQPPPGIGAFFGQINRYANSYKDMVTGDFNADGRDDVAFSTAKNASNEQSGNIPSRVGIMLQTAEGKLSAPAYVDFPAVVRPPSIEDFHGGGLAVTDIDGDRIADILIAQGNGIGLIRGSRAGPFQLVSFSGHHGAPADRLLVMDVNRDGSKDVVARSLEAPGSTQAGLSVYLGSGPHAFRRDFIALPFLPFGSMAAGDFSGDGLPDLVLGYTVTGADDGGAALLLHDGQSGFLSAALYPASGNGKANLAVGDLDGDGMLDIAVTRNRTRTNADVHILYQRFAGQFQRIALATAPEPDNLLIADVDRDGRQDLIVLHVNNASFGYFQQSPSRGLTTEARYAGGGSYNYAFNPVAIGDVNGDGHLDLVLREGNSGVYVRTGTGRKVGFRVNGGQPMVPSGNGGNMPLIPPVSGASASVALPKLPVVDTPTPLVNHRAGALAGDARALRRWAPQMAIRRARQAIHAWMAGLVAFGEGLFDGSRAEERTSSQYQNIPSPSPTLVPMKPVPATFARPLRAGRSAVCDHLR